MASRRVRAPRGPQISCRGWPQEAALRMLMNNLDPDVAEKPDELIAGLGPMAAPQRMATTINGGVGLSVEVDPARTHRRLSAGWVDQATYNMDEPLRSVEEAKRAGHPQTVALLGNSASVYAE